MTAKDEARRAATRPEGAGRRTAHDEVYQALRTRLIEGALEPGAALTLRGVAAELEVSMTPAREAVRRLVAERALALTASGRILVPVPDHAALDALFTARRLLEPELARRAAGTTDDHAALADRLRVLDAATDAAIAAGDVEGYVRANTAFHAALYATASAPALVALVESVWLQTAPTMRRVYGRMGTGAMHDYHADAIAALEQGDTDALVRAIAADVGQGAALAAELSA
ncbi:MAG: GntR family transcriptional regulator [Pseudomonadota bacterium]